MKFLNSIKWRLQLWYGLILVAVLAGLGVTAYQLERNRQLRRVDDELVRRFSMVANLIHPRPFHGPDGGRQPDDQFPPPEPESEDMPPIDDRRSESFHLPTRFLSLFDSGDRNDFYFVIGFRDGRAPMYSTNAPAETLRFGKVPGSFPSANVGEPPESQSNIQNQQNPPGPPRPQTFGERREINLAMPPGLNVRVGCSIAPELKELRMTAIKLGCFGGGILIFGLAGGWWFVGRALRPIAEISATAAKISSGDLAQRINAAGTESELGQLAAVLNSTFARLETAFAQQKQFASDAAHELRTPVSVILTQTQTALTRVRSAEDYRQTVEACQRAAQRMRKLIESLLELARFDAGQEVLKRLPFDCSKTISECLDLVKPLAEDRGVKIISELAPLEISGDSERLGQVVMNLLTNAIQFSRAGGEVRVKLEARGGMTVLGISDTGQGIVADDLPRVFERFYRGDKSRTGGGSSGLGLSICKAIVEAHGGTIEVTSEHGAGATFTVRLPM